LTASFCLVSLGLVILVSSTAAIWISRLPVGGTAWIPVTSLSLAWFSCPAIVATVAASAALIGAPSPRSNTTMAAGVVALGKAFSCSCAAWIDS